MGKMVKLDADSPIALYFQLKQIIMDKIRSGEWAAYSRLPTESEFSQTYEISRATVRQALNELEYEGYIMRKQGRGTFVKPMKIEQKLNDFYSFSEEIRKMGYTPSTKVYDFQVIVSDEKLSSIMNIPLNTPLYWIKRIRLANGEPFAVEDSYIPCSACPGLSQENIESKGLYDTMRDVFHFYPDTMDETIEAVLIPHASAELLHTQVRAAGLFLRRLAYYQNNMIIWWNIPRPWSMETGTNIM